MKLFTYIEGAMAISHTEQRPLKRSCHGNHALQKGLNDDIWMVSIVVFSTDIQVIVS